MNLQKIKPFRNKKYREFVRSLPCCITAREGQTVPHHIISCGMGGVMGDKVSDLFSIPVDAEVHTSYHSQGLFRSIDQKAEALRTIEKALDAGVLKID